MAANPLDRLKVAKTFPSRGTVFALARVPGTRRLFLGGSDFKVYDLDLAAPGPEPKEIGAHASYVTGLALAGKSLVSGGYDGRLIWWDVDRRRQVRAVDAHRKWIRGVAACLSASQSRGRGPFTRESVAMPSLLKPVMATSNVSPRCTLKLPSASSRSARGMMPSAFDP